MKPLDDKKIDELLSSIGKSCKPKPDFEKWCAQNPQAVNALKMQTGKNIEDKQTQLRRKIMRNPIMKLAIAACIIIVVIIGVKHFTGSVNITPIALADISEAMKKTPWMYGLSKGIQGGISGTAESWVGFDAKILAGKSSEGYIQLLDLKEEKFYVYDQNKKTITVQSIHKENYPLDLFSPAAYLESLLKEIHKQGIQIVTKKVKYEGREVQLQELLEKRGDSRLTARLYIDPDTKLLLAAYTEEVDSEGKIVSSADATYSYPVSGPKDIYELGVPRDAKIIIEQSK